MGLRLVYALRGAGGLAEPADRSRGVWLVEFAELDKLHRADADRAKSFISTRVDRLRLPYGTAAEDFKRQCVFAGTLNPGGIGYLKDETGARRFWPVECGVSWDERRQVDIDALTAATGQLWAEAASRHATGAQWWLTAAEDALQGRAANKRFAEDVWAGRIRDYLADLNDTSSDDVLIECLRVPVERWTQGDRNRVAHVLRADGWDRRQVSVGGKRQWRYFRDGVGEVVPIKARPMLIKDAS